MKITDEQLYAHAAEARDLWLNTLPSTEDLVPHSFSSRFERKMRPLLRRQRRSPWANQALRTIKTAAAILLIAATVTFSTMMTVEAYRVKFIEVVTQVFNELTDYQFSTERETGDLPDLTFEYLPEGMKEISRTEQENYRYILYSNDNGKIIEFKQYLLRPGDTGTVILDTEGTISESFYIKGEDAVMHTENGDTNVLWTWQNTVYLLHSNLPPEELKTVAENIN